MDVRCFIEKVVLFSDFLEQESFLSPNHVTENFFPGVQTVGCCKLTNNASSISIASRFPIEISQRISSSHHSPVMILFQKITRSLYFAIDAQSMRYCADTTPAKNKKLTMNRMCSLPHHSTTNFKIALLTREPLGFLADEQCTRILGVAHDFEHDTFHAHDLRTFDEHRVTFRENFLQFPTGFFGCVAGQHM